MQQFKVEGMTCAHCERAVAEAVHSIDTAAQVTVDLAAGIVTTSSDASAEKLERAIEAEGYEAHGIASTPG